MDGWLGFCLWLKHNFVHSFKTFNGKISKISLEKKGHLISRIVIFAIIRWLLWVGNGPCLHKNECYRNFLQKNLVNKQYKGWFRCLCLTYWYIQETRTHTSALQSVRGYKFHPLMPEQLSRFSKHIYVILYGSLVSFLLLACRVTGDLKMQAAFECTSSLTPL